MALLALFKRQEEKNREAQGKVCCSRNPFYTGILILSYPLNNVYTGPGNHR